MSTTTPGDSASPASAQLLPSLLQQLKAPSLWRRNAARGRWHPWWTTLLLALALLVPAAAGLWWVPPRIAGVLASLLVLTGGAVLWGARFAALLRLDHPHFARLVPRHAAVLRVTAVFTWALMLVLGGGLVAALLSWAGHAAFTLPMALTAAGAVLLYTAMALRWPWLWLFVWLLPFPISIPGMGSLRQLLLDAALPLWQARPWIACATLLLAMALVLVALFGRGDTAHARTFQRRELRRRIAETSGTGQKAPLAAYGHWGAWLTRPWQRLSDAWLAHCITHASPTRASVMARAEVVLQGPQHWVRQLGVLVPFLLILVLVLSLVGLSTDTGMQSIYANGHVGMGIGLVSVVLGPVVSLPGTLWASRREQALLMLVPGMPRGTALNHALARGQARHFLMLWGLTLPLSITIAVAGDVPQVLAFPAVVLPMLAWVWRDSARMRMPSAMASVPPFLCCLALAIGFVVLWRAWPDALLPCLFMLALATGLLLRWRWTRLAHWPHALPAGRLG